MMMMKMMGEMQDSRAPGGFYPVVEFQLVMKTSPKGFLTSKCDVGYWIFFQIRNFLRNYLGFFLIFLGFFWMNFFGWFFWEDVLGGFFWKDFFGRIFLGGFFGRIFESIFRGILCLHWNWHICQDFDLRENMEFS